MSGTGMKGRGYFIYGETKGRQYERGRQRVNALRDKLSKSTHILLV